MEEKGSILFDKSRDFALRIIKLYKYLTTEKKEYVMSKQVLRSGTSIGANIAEGRYGQSSADFASKYSISQKEVAETLYWLELLYKSEFLSEQEYTSIYNDAIELMKLLTASLKTVRRKNEPINR